MIIDSFRKKNPSSKTKHKQAQNTNENWYALRDSGKWIGKKWVEKVSEVKKKWSRKVTWRGYKRAVKILYVKEREKKKEILRKLYNFLKFSHMFFSLFSL